MRMILATPFDGVANSLLRCFQISLKKAIEFFGRQELGRFRFITKFTEVDSLLDAHHRGHTRFCFSINTQHVIKKYSITVQ